MWHLFPRTLEAMTTQMAVVGPEVRGIDELVEEDGAGLVLPIHKTVLGQRTLSFHGR